MDPNRTTDRILDEWDAVASTARPPSAAPRRRGSVAGVASALGLAGAGVLAAALVVGVVWLGGRISPGVGGPGTPPPAASAGAVATLPTASPLATPSAHTSQPPTHAPATPAATPTPRPQTACSADDLTARITAWEGAAGSRIADVTVKNTSAAACGLSEPVAVHLVDGVGRDLITGDGPGGPDVSLAAGASVTTLVDASNYCGAAPAPPVRLTFDLGGGRHLTAEPPTSNDATVPPCNGSTVPASIQMQRWSR